MDDDGYFWYQARTDDMIISAGYNIAGPEVEAALLGHPAVAECGVVGAPDEERGQIVKAFVVLRPASPPSRADAQPCRTTSRRRSRPTSTRARSSLSTALPRTETGKLQRLRAAPAMAETAPAEASIVR